MKHIRAMARSPRMANGACNCTDLKEYLGFTEEECYQKGKCE